MTDQPNSNESAYTQALTGLRLQVDGNIAAQRQRRRILVGVFASLAVLMAFSLASTANQARAISVDDVTLMGRVELQERLPGGRDVLQAYLAEEAPFLVSQAVDDMLRSLPAIREQMVASLSARLDAVNTEFEQRATQYMDEAIAQARADIEAAYPDAADKPELIARDAARYFEVRVQQTSNEIYPLYADLMAQVNEWVERVMTSDPSTLDPSDLRRRELIETTLILVRRMNLGEIELR